MSLDPRRRFDAAAGDYDRCRPSYPLALVEWVLATTGARPPARVADIGCGTGISTRLFAGRGFDVVGIDPSEPMLVRARAHGGARYQRGEASATGLPAASVDLVTVAQAFHWFDLDATLRELRRILRPTGFCVAFWNVRGLSAFTEDYDRILRAFSSEYEILEKPEAAREALRRASGVCDVHDAEFAHTRAFDKAGLLGFAHSTSYVVHGVADARAFDRALRDLFDRRQAAGTVEFLYRTIAIAFRPGP